MDRSLNKISTRYALHLTANEFKRILLRDVERLLNYKMTLSNLLEETYVVDDVVVANHMLIYSIVKHLDNEVEHDMIHSKIELYIEGLETKWTGVDSTG